MSAFVASLPSILAADQLRAVAESLISGREKKRPLIWGMGAHVLKVGLAPVIIDLMERGFITAIALNGAGIVHDFETAVAGQTSEEVDAVLGAGQFGMARETGEELNRAIIAGDRDGLGLGAAVGRAVSTRPKTKHRRLSILAAAWRLGIPATVHVAIGTDIVHMHPSCDPAAIGRASHLDFRAFAAEVARLGRGGVYLNVGSAVLLPEVFLKAVTLARNLGHKIEDFTTANFDFIQGYRPNTNVVRLLLDRSPRDHDSSARGHAGRVGSLVRLPPPRGTGRIRRSCDPGDFRGRSLSRRRHGEWTVPLVLQRPHPCLRGSVWPHTL
jgi:hypothetical protein